MPKSDDDTPVAHASLPLKVYEAELVRLQAELVQLQEWVKATGQRVGDVVALQRHRVGLAGVAGALEGALHPRHAAPVERVGRRRERLEDRSSEDVLAGAADGRQVGVVAVDQHEVAVHDHVRRRQGAEQCDVVDRRRAAAG